MSLSEEQKLKDIRRAYVLARALNIQYQWIREFLNPELKKAANDAKAANSYFIKKIDDVFKRRLREDKLINEEEELAFKLLEELEKLNTDKDVNK
jgi:glycine cleavage system protein P-like pyridoxal-binding family